MRGILSLSASGTPANLSISNLYSRYEFVHTCCRPAEYVILQHPLLHVRCGRGRPDAIVALHVQLHDSCSPWYHMLFPHPHLADPRLITGCNEFTDLGIESLYHWSTSFTASSFASALNCSVALVRLHSTFPQPTTTRPALALHELFPSPRSRRRLARSHTPGVQVPTQQECTGR